MAEKSEFISGPNRSVQTVPTRRFRLFVKFAVADREPSGNIFFSFYIIFLLKQCIFFIIIITIIVWAIHNEVLAKSPISLWATTSILISKCIINFYA